MWMIFSCPVIKEFLERVVQALRRDFQVGSEDKNDIMFVGQRIRWTKDSK